MTQAELFAQLDTKPSWGRVEVKELINKLSGDLYVMNTLKIVEELKKYDIIRINTLQSVHYAIVHRIKDGIVYGVLITSKQECHNLMEIRKERQFKGSYATKTYLCWPLETAIPKFVKVYEDKREADLIFRKLKQFYKETLNI